MHEYVEGSGFCLRLPYTFRGVSRPRNVARPVQQAYRAGYTKNFEMKWIDEFFTTPKCERPNHHLRPFESYMLKGICSFPP